MHDMSRSTFLEKNTVNTRAVLKPNPEPSTTRVWSSCSSPKRASRDWSYTLLVRHGLLQECHIISSHRLGI